MHNPYTNIDALIQANASAEALAEAVVRKHYSRVYRLCLTIVAEPDEAADAAQEAFIAALADIERYEPGTSFRAWLSRIAVNKCYTLLRQRKRRQAINEALRWFRVDTHSSRAGRPAEGSSDMGDELQDAVKDLGPKHETVIRLRYMQGLPIQKIAEILGVPEGTVHSRIHYAIRRLRRMLRD